MTEPKLNDYVQLLDSDNNPCEAFTYIDKWQFKPGDGLYIISDTNGEDFAVARCPELDTDIYNGWQQVITATA